jgi:WD40 repeat protein
VKAFREAILELELIRPEEFDRIAASPAGGVPDLARALVRAGKLTAYQAGAVAQGKTRGLLIGNYCILDKLGEGGMGVVFKARHRRLGRVVALKILPPSFARNAQTVLRFRREVEVAARLSHPNIVSVLDADEDRGVQFLTMEYIEGRDLDHLVQERGPMTVEQALDCLVQAARGLEAAHEQGIIHRDIKPANLMRDASGRVRVLDLGLARLIEAASAFADTAADSLTQTGTFMGTADFMAPEQATDSHRADQRADIYSLGCTLHFLLIGRPPFEGGTVINRLMAHQEQPPPSLRAARPEVSGVLEAVYQKLMAKNPDHRPRSMSEVIALLQPCQLALGERASVPTTDYPELGPKRAQSPWTILRRPAMVALGLLGLLALGVAGRALVPRFAPVKQATGPAVVKAVATALVKPVAPVVAKPKVVPLPDVEETDTTGWMLCDRSALRSKHVGPDGLNPHGSGSELIVYEKPVDNFHLELDYRLTAGGSTAVFFRVGNLNNPVKTGLAVALSDTTGTGLTDSGAILGLVAPRVNAQKPAGAWNHLTIRAQGESVVVIVNGKPVSEIHLDDWHVTGRRPDGTPIATKPQAAIAIRDLPRSGHLGFQDRGAHCWFKNVVLLTLPTPDAARTYDVATCSYRHLGDDVNAIAVTPDGRRILSGGNDHHARLWDLDGGDSIHNFPLGSPVTDLAIAPDGLRAVAGTRGGPIQGGTVRLLDLKTGTGVVLPRLHHGPVRAVAIGPHGHRAISGGQDGTLILWDLIKERPVRLLGPPSGFIHEHGIAFHPDGRRGATAGEDSFVHVWDLESGRPLARWEGHRGSVTGLAFSPDGRRAVSGSNDATLILWDVATGSMIRRLTMPEGDRGPCVAFLGNGTVVAAGGEIGHLVLWDPNTGAILRRDVRPIARHLAVASLPDGRVLTGDQWGIRIWTPAETAALALGGDRIDPPCPGGDGSSGASVDLLALVDVDRDAFLGSWKRKDGALLSPTTPWARLQIPYVPPPEYTIDMVVERQSEGHTLVLGFRAGGQPAMLAIDGGTIISTVTGLEGADGIPLRSNATAFRARLLLPSSPARLSLTVRRDAITFTCDGKTIVAWRGDPKRLIRLSRWEPPDKRKLFLGSSASFLVRSMTLTPLD